MHPLPSSKSKRLQLLIACFLALITTVYSFQYFAEQNQQKQEITIMRDQVEGLVRKKIDEEGLVKDYRVLIDGEDNFGWHVSVFDATKPNNEGLVGWYSVNRSTGEVKFLAP